MRRIVGILGGGLGCDLILLQEGGGMGFGIFLGRWGGERGSESGRTAWKRKRNGPFSRVVDETHEFSDV